MKFYMARDQYGQSYHDLGKHPRSKLMQILGKSSASKMYCDKKSGATVHVGWIIGGLWLTVYEVIPMEIGA